MQVYEGLEGKNIPHAGTQKKTKWSTSVDILGEQISEVEIRKRSAKQPTGEPGSGESSSQNAWFI